MVASAVSRVNRAFIHHEDVWVVRGITGVIDTEPLCASCLRPAANRRRERSPSGTTTIQISYCDSCHTAQGQHNVQRLAWVLATVLLGVTGTIFFPLMPWLSKWAAVCGALACAALPWAVGQLWLRRAASRAPRRSAVAVQERVVVCTNQDWARRLARSSGDVIHQRVRRPVVTGWSVTGLVVAAVATPVLYDLFQCETRILNLTEAELVISVDGHRVAIVRPTSQENPLAGVIVRMPIGLRYLQARGHDGTLVHAEAVRIATAQAYLYAPAHPADTCFWIEQTSLGRARAAAPQYLPRDKDFWRVPLSIDTWFIPASGSESSFFTGGVVTSLRQGACSTSRAGNGGAAASF